MIPVANQAWHPAPRSLLVDWHPATRLMLGVLAIVTALVAPPLVVGGLAAVLVVSLTLVGLCWSRLPALTVPWLPLMAVVIAAHTLSATDAAPLWTPTRVGFGRGVLTVCRLIAMVGAVAVIGRAMSVSDLTTAMSWWLRPLSRLGLDTSHLGLAVAVALGTAPRTQAEAARLQACLRLRRPPGRRTLLTTLRERVRVVPPLMEGLARRAETLPLVVAWRIPTETPHVSSPPWGQFVGLGVWVAALIWLV